MVNVKLLNYACASNIVIRHLDLLLNHTILLEMGQEIPARANDLVPCLNTVIWAAYKLNIQALEQISSMVEAVYGKQYIRHAMEGFMVERQLRSYFQNVLATPYEIYCYLVDFASRSTNSVTERDVMLSKMGVDPFGAPPTKPETPSDSKFEGQKKKFFGNEKEVEEKKLEPKSQIYASRFNAEDFPAGENKDINNLAQDDDNRLKQSVLLKEESKLSQSIMEIDQNFMKSMQEKFEELDKIDKKDPADQGVIDEWSKQNPFCTSNPNVNINQNQNKNFASQANGNNENSQDDFMKQLMDFDGKVNIPLPTNNNHQNVNAPDLEMSEQKPFDGEFQRTFNGTLNLPDFAKTNNKGEKEASLNTQKLRQNDPFKNMNQLPVNISYDPKEGFDPRQSVYAAGKKKYLFNFLGVGKEIVAKNVIHSDVASKLRKLREIGV